MKKKYIIRLSAEERQNLTDLVRKGKVAAYRRTHAQILLFTDEGELGVVKSVSHETIRKVLKKTPLLESGVCVYTKAR